MSYRKYLMTDDVPPSELYKTVKIDTDSDTISRQAVLDALNNIEIPRNASWYQYYQQALTAVGKLPPAQPEPFTSKWIPIGMADAVGGESAMWGDKIAYHVCEKCWKQALERDGEEVLSDFCPNCGADMRGEQDG